MQLVIDVKESALDKVMYLLNHLKEDVTIVKNEQFKSIEIEQLLKERENRDPKEYVTFDEIKWA